MESLKLTIEIMKIDTLLKNPDKYQIFCLNCGSRNFIIDDKLSCLFGPRGIHIWKYKEIGIQKHIDN